MRLLPDADWWIKADGVDVVPGISESVQKQWSRDVNLADGAINQTHDAYLKCLKSKNIGLGPQNGHLQIQQDLIQLELDLTDDISFLSSGKRCVIPVLYG